MRSVQSVVAVPAESATGAVAQHGAFLPCKERACIVRSTGGSHPSLASLQGAPASLPDALVLPITSRTLTARVTAGPDRTAAS